MRIHNSMDITQIFEAKVKANVDNPLKNCVKNVSAAKHRYDSYAKPDGTFALQLDPYFGTAMVVAANREGETVAQDMKDFLDFVDEEDFLE